MTNFVMGIVVFALAAFSWGSLTAYIGMATFLATLPRAPRFGVFVFTAITILLPAVCFLIDQHSYTSLYAFTFENATPDHDFYAGFFVVNACFFVGVTLSFFGARRLPSRLGVRVGRICACTALTAMPWTLWLPHGLFLPFAFFPDDELLASRLAILAFCLLVGTGTFCWLSAVENRSQN
jgi:hypothetical protein